MSTDTEILNKIRQIVSEGTNVNTQILTLIGDNVSADTTPSPKEIAEAKAKYSKLIKIEFDAAKRDYKYFVNIYDVNGSYEECESFPNKRARDSYIKATLSHIDGGFALSYVFDTESSKIVVPVELESLELV